MVDIGLHIYIPKSKLANQCDILKSYSFTTILTSIEYRSSWISGWPLNIFSKIDFHMSLMILSRGPVDWPSTPCTLKRQTALSTYE